MHIVKTEMGQHIGTGLAQVIAEELEVKWEDVRLDSPLESVENFAIYGLAYTVNSGSMTTEFDRISRAGAAGRMALIDAAAGLLGASVSNCTASNSRVTDSVSGKSLSYGEILQRAKERGAGANHGPVIVTAAASTATTTTTARVIADGLIAPAARLQQANAAGGRVLCRGDERSNGKQRC